MAGEGASIKLVIADDHTLFREMLRENLNAETGISVVGEAKDSESAVHLAAEMTPDMILLDAGIPSEIIECVRRVKMVSPTSQVIVVTMHDDPWLIRTLLSMGINGYILKSVTRRELVSAIKGICAKQDRVVLLISSESITRALQADSGEISRRERDILMLVARGLSNAQIASHLSIAEGTVKRHLGNIFAKLGAESRVDAVNKAAAASLIPFGLGNLL